MNYFWQRLAEPSSWAGMAALAAGIEHTVTTAGGWPAAIPMVVGGIAALFMPENNSTSGSASGTGGTNVTK